MGRHAGISPRTTKRILRSQKFSYKRCNSKIFLDEERRNERISFAEKMLKRRNASIWDRVLISDECTFYLNRARPSKLWTQDAMLEEGTKIHGPKVHCLGGFTRNGALKIEIFSENLKAKKYLKILEKKVVKMDDLYPEGWIFQHDGSGVHRANKVQKFINGLEEEPLKWPPYSPDLSPIENVWAWLKNQVSLDMPTTIRSLKQSIRRHWNRIDSTFLSPYFNSMSKRMSMVIENEGRRINY